MTYIITLISIAFITSSCLPPPGGIGGGPSTDDISPVPFETESENPAPPPPSGDIGFFPYDIKFDTIAYLPCESSGFRVLRTGAYFSRSGVRLSDYYLNKYNSKNIDQMSPILQKSHYFKTYPIARIDERNTDLKDVMTSLKSADKLSHFKLERYHRDIIRTGRKRLLTLNNSPLKEEFSFSSTFDSRALFSDSTDKWNLVLYYRTQDNKVAWKPKDSTSNPLLDFHGRVYSLGVDNLSHVHSELDARYALTSITETKPLDSSINNDWSCPESLRLEVRRHPDFAYKKHLAYQALKSRGSQTIKKKNESQLISAGYLFSDENLCENSSQGGNKLSIARAVLGDDWNINIGKKCISPKNSSKRCYPNLGTANEQVDRLMNTNHSSELCSPNKGHSNNYQGNAFKDIDPANQNIIRTFACPYFLSICVRTDSN